MKLKISQVKLLYIYDWMLRNLTNINIMKMILNELEKHSINTREFKNYFTKYLVSPSESNLTAIWNWLTGSLKYYIEDNSYDGTIPDIFEITKNKNDNLRYSKDGGETWNDITLPEGIYDLGKINKSIHTIMRNIDDYDKNEGGVEKFPIYVSKNLHTDKYRIELRYVLGIGMTEELQVDLTVPNSIGRTLGFNPQILTKEENISEKESNGFLNQRWFYVHPMVRCIDKEFNISKDFISREKLSSSTIYDILEWLKININNYIDVVSIVDELEVHSLNMTDFKNLYTSYLLPTGPVSNEMLIQEIEKIQDTYKENKSEFKTKIMMEHNVFFRGIKL